MNKRKQHVIEMAYKLFIEKGFQATSIQDILDFSGISKGTFYNYFSSKNELLIALFKTLYQNIGREMNDLLIGQDPANIEIFIKQIEFQMEMNQSNKLATLFEEAFSLNDLELKQFFKHGQLRILRWIYERFIDIYGENLKPYLLDCSIMFMGMLIQSYKMYVMEHSPDTSIQKIVRFSINRITKMVKEVSESDDQLIEPEFLDRWLPDKRNSGHAFKTKLYQILHKLKQEIPCNKNQTKYMELLDFIENEILHARNPRKHLIGSVILSLKIEQLIEESKIQELEDMVEEYFSNQQEEDDLRSS